ncbi:SUMF1/EgtB/PvdO family nonheme iron enzyme [Roseibium sp. SCP14]|uniref:SUMF1/EgtB/PvdO family nonheme iron enzyme n=1 Tax=Roseibium sp. SCP14 TaxID=3141375 RepID=UPI0033397B28
MARRLLHVGMLGFATIFTPAASVLADENRSMECRGPDGSYQVHYAPEDKVLQIDNREIGFVLPPADDHGTYMVSVVIDAAPVIALFEPQHSVVYNSFDGSRILREDPCRPIQSATRTGEETRGHSLLEIQELLNGLGLNTGPVDGVEGRRTRSAIAAFQRLINAPATGMMTPGQTRQLIELVQKSRAETADMQSRHDAEETLEAPPSDVTFFKDCEYCPEMASLPNGRFMMGATPEDKRVPFVELNLANALPRHEVTLDYSFAIGRFEVSVEEFDRFVKETGREVGGSCTVRLIERGPLAHKHSGTLHPDSHKIMHGPNAVIISDGSYRRPGLPVNDRQPATCISRGEAEAYLQWLNTKTGRAYRLPTEAEWEYAARAGTETIAFWGNDLSRACEFSNFADQHSGYAVGIASPCAETIRREWTAEVGSYKPNPWGLYDMFGNVQEMTADCFFTSHADSPADGTARARSGCTVFVARGGGYELPYTSMRASERLFYGYDPEAPNDIKRGRSNALGFRVALSLRPETTEATAQPSRDTTQPASEITESQEASVRKVNTEAVQPVHSSGHTWKALGNSRFVTGDIAMGENSLTFGNGTRLSIKFVTERTGPWAVQKADLPGKIYKLDPPANPSLLGGYSLCDEPVTYLVFAQPSADQLIMLAFVGDGMPFTSGYNLCANYDFVR